MIWARLAILTGLRQSEQFSLKWADIDQGIITLPVTKANRVQYVYLNNEAEGILRRIQVVAEAEAIADPHKRSAWVFPSDTRSTHMAPRTSIRIYRPVVEAAGLSDVNWRCLRHTYASRLAMNGATESTIAALRRHSGTGLVVRYAHLSPSHLRVAVEGVATFGNPTVTKTGTQFMESKEKQVEMLEQVGAGDGI